LLGGVEFAGEVLDELEFGLGKLIGLPDLIAELTVTDDLLDVKVDASALHHVRKKAKAKSVRTAFGDTLSKLVL
jgi:hypothetical protein